MKHEPAAFKHDEMRFSHSDGLIRKTVFLGGKLGTVETTAVAAPDVLERLHNRSTITDKQHAAAVAWATDYERGGLSVAVCASYGGSVSVGVEAEPERRRAAKERFRRGYAAMTGRGASLAWGVIIDNHELKHWPQSTAYVSERLREALEELAEAYG